MRNRHPFSGSEGQNVRKAPGRFHRLFLICTRPPPSSDASPFPLSSKLVLVQNVSKLYRLYRRPSDRLRELLPGSRPRHTDFWALQDIGFSVEKGETLSLVGPNGCG